ncbi:MAG: protein translocase subunit SecD [Thermoanaerobaculia bacterium]|nr:protein translocase subunit SecD [Thermoanaerobaculia bacterium]
MNRSLLWRGVFYAVLLVLLGWSAWPLDEKIKLGLDLKGGMHLVMKVTTDDAVRADTGSEMDRIIRGLAEEKVPGVSGSQSDVRSFELRGVPGDKDSVLSDLVGPTFDWRRDGDRLLFTMNSAEERNVRRLAVGQAVQTINNRVNAFNVSEPEISSDLERERIILQLPGVDDPARVKELIKKTAFLEFRLVNAPYGGAPTREALLGQFGGVLPANTQVLPMDIRDEATKKVTGERYYAVEASSAVSGRDLKNSRPRLGTYGEPVVGFTLTPEAGNRFADITGANINRPLCIVLDGRIVSVANIQSQIRDEGQISGSFTQEEVQDLVTTLRSGALPAGLMELEERTVGPSLGAEAIRQGVKSGWIGTALVVLLMLIYYKGAGVNAVLMLAFDAVLVFGALAYFGFTLTLPGIAGLVLTVGMAVDANVLVFERIKEELRRGRTVKSAIESGFTNARSSILDANITTLIAAAFLYQFGSGPIRGFAVTLSIGIFASVFTALFVSRWFFDFMGSRQARVERLSI